MLKVGDKVRVRKDLKVNDYIQGYYVTDDMFTKVGQVVTISRIFNKGIKDEMCYEVKELHSLGVGFTDGMFELEGDCLKCPNCGKPLQLEKTNFHFDGALYDVYGCEGCTHIMVWDWREDFNPIASDDDIMGDEEEEE